MNKVAIYIRVSTDEQATKGNSLAEQEERLRAYCKAMGWEDVVLFPDDGYSAKDTNRPHLQEMLSRVRKKEFNMIVTTKIDRLCRNLLDLLTIVDELSSYQCGYASASESFDTSTPAGRMVLQILGAFAEFERERIRERVKENMKSIVAKGEKAVSRPCFGYNIENGKYVINEDEAAVVRNMADYILQGMGARRIMQAIKGVKTKEGNPFTAEAINKLLRRETLAGMFVYNRRYVHKGKELIRPKAEWIIVENHHEPILEKDLFDKVQLAMNARSTGHRQADNEKWLLSGLVYCTHCGRKMIGRARSKPSGKVYYHYVCSGYMKKAECFHHYIERDEFEDKVIQSLINVQEIHFSLGAQAFEDKNEQLDTTVDVKGLNDRLKKLDNKMQRQIELYEDEAINKDDFKIASKRIDKERNEILTQLKQIEDNNSARMIGKFVSLVDDLKDDLVSQNRALIKNAIRLSVQSIDVTNGSHIDIKYRIFS
ncbi:recombinase family protein [Paenibacillus contaminans]|uniref:Recombinase family protein n=1 Tax=Paenibacillus contaminans TaxID=450362 RepID=A0A329MJ95_9BACL|nr:recombinase family protein [Paenibacillus contaminans]RAV18803.1 recombinase family protein [Paenibacillus contaminans]